VIAYVSVWVNVNVSVRVKVRGKGKSNSEINIRVWVNDIVRNVRVSVRLTSELNNLKKNIFKLNIGLGAANL